MGESETVPDSARAGALVTRWLVRRLLPLLALLLAAIGWQHVTHRAEDLELSRQAAAGVVALQHQILERELQVVGSTALYLANQRAVREFLAGRGSREAVADDFLAFCRTSDMFDQLRLLDDDGSEMVRVNWAGGAPTSVPREELQEKSDRYYFRIARELPPGELYVSPFDLNVEHGAIEEPWKPVFRLATSTVADGRRAVVVVNYRGASILERLRQAAAPLGGWSALVDERGFYLQAPDERDSWGFMFDREPTFARAYPDAWEAMQRTPAGSAQQDGGLLTFRSFPSEAPSPAGHDDLRLRLVTFVPGGVLYAESTRSLRLMATVGALTALVLALATFRLAQAAAVRKAHEERLEASEARLRVLSTGLLNAQEAERRSLSRDLHDELGQIATAITIDLKQAQRKPQDRDALLERAVAKVGALLESIHAISTRIRTTMLDDLGLREALLEHCAEFAQRSGIAVDARIEVEDTRVPPSRGVHVYRIVQESLNNVAKHARAERVEVRVAPERDGLAIRVRDDGAGFDPARAGDGRLGLLGMRERVELLGGRFRVDSRPGEGTTVEAWIPHAPEGAAP